MSSYSFEELLLVLQPLAPLQVAALQRGHRRVDHGLSTVGLKLHCLEEDRATERFIAAMGDRVHANVHRPYRHKRSSITFVLPPVGNARCATYLIEAFELFFGYRIFNSPRYQIHVCSPCRLDRYYAGMLTLAFYLGSDMLRRYTLADMETTFSVDKKCSMSRGRRIALYDGGGELDRDYEWWNLEGDKLNILPRLPFHEERTDVLTCQTQVDIKNVNLVATLLTHYQHLGWWEHVGDRFVKEFEALLERHLLSGILRAPWIHPGNGSIQEDDDFFRALKEVMAYAFDEYRRLQKPRPWWNKTPPQSGILMETRQLLASLREQIINESLKLFPNGGET